MQRLAPSPDLRQHQQIPPCLQTLLLHFPHQCFLLRSLYPAPDSRQPRHCYCFLPAHLPLSLFLDPLHTRSPACPLSASMPSRQPSPLPGVVFSSSCFPPCQLFPRSSAKGSAGLKIHRILPLREFQDTADRNFSPAGCAVIKVQACFMSRKAEGSQSPELLFPNACAI